MATPPFLLFGMYIRCVCVCVLVWEDGQGCAAVHIVSGEDHLLPCLRCVCVGGVSCLVSFWESCLTPISRDYRFTLLADSMSALGIRVSTVLTGSSP